MAVVILPRYPTIGLREAIEKIRMVYETDYQNTIPKRLVAEHMGYSGLNGKSLGVIAAVTKYGLIEGRAEEMRVTDRALLIIAHERGHPERAKAILEAAGAPALFAELSDAFVGKVSDAALRSYLLTKKKFQPDSADRAIRAYRDTHQLVAEETTGIESASLENKSIQATAAQADPSVAHSIEQIHNNVNFEVRREVFNLEEGDVTLTYPAAISAESYDDLLSYLRIFVRKAKRRAEKGAEASFTDFEELLG